MKGLALTEETFEETIPTFEVRTLIDRPTSIGPEDAVLELALTDLESDGVTLHIPSLDVEVKGVMYGGSGTSFRDPASVAPEWKLDMSPHGGLGQSLNDLAIDTITTWQLGDLAFMVTTITFPVDLTSQYDGVYVLTHLGNGSTPPTFMRAPGYDSAPLVLERPIIKISDEDSVFGGTFFILSTDAPIVLDVTPLTHDQTSDQPDFGEGDGDVFLVNNARELSEERGGLEPVPPRDGLYRFVGIGVSETGEEELAPAELQFTLDDTIERFELLPPALVFVDDPFTDTSTTRFTKYSESTAGTLSIAGGQLTLTNAAGAAHGDLVREGAAIGMPQVMVQVDIVERTGSDGAFAVAYLGILKDVNNYISVIWDGPTNALIRQTKTAGSFAFGSTHTGWTAPFTLGLSIVGNSVVIWGDRGSGWEWVEASTAPVDLTVADLSTWFGFFGFASPGTFENALVLDNFKVGRFGGVGLRDMTIVTQEDGTPYIVGGTVRFLGTATDSEGIGSLGAFTLDLGTHEITQNGVIMVSRGGAIRNDLAAHLIWYANGDRRLFISTWGGGALQILHKLETSLELLTGSRIVSGMSALALTGDTGAPAGVYDPFVIKRGETWFIAYTKVTNTNFIGDPFYTVLDTSPDLAAFTNVGADTVHNGYEGTRLIVVDDELWVMSGSVAGGVRIYDDSLSFVGTLDATFTSSGGLPPHPMLFASDEKILMLTFDNTKFNSVLFTIGKVEIHEADRFRPTEIALLERIPTLAPLFEVLEGTRFAGTFWKNLTLVSEYVPDVSPFYLEQLEIDEV